MADRFPIPGGPPCMASLGTIEAWPAFAIAFTFVVIWTTMAGVESLIVVRIARRAALKLARQLKRSASTGQTLSEAPRAAAVESHLGGRSAEKEALTAPAATPVGTAASGSEPSELPDAENPSNVHASQLLPTRCDADAVVAVGASHGRADSDSETAVVVAAGTAAAEADKLTSFGTECGVGVAAASPHEAADDHASVPARAPTGTMPRLRMLALDADAAASPVEDGVPRDAPAALLPGAPDAELAGGDGTPQAAGADDERICMKQPQPGAAAVAGAFATRLSTSRQVSSQGATADCSARRRADDFLQETSPAAAAGAEAVSSSDRVASAAVAFATAQGPPSARHSTGMGEALGAHDAAASSQALAQDGRGVSHVDRDVASDPAGHTPAHTAVAVSIVELLPAASATSPLTVSPSAAAEAACTVPATRVAAVGADAGALAASASGITVGLVETVAQATHPDGPGQAADATAEAGAGTGAIKDAGPGADEAKADAVVNVAAASDSVAAAADGSHADASESARHAKRRAACTARSGAVGNASVSTAAPDAAPAVPAAPDRFRSPLRPLARSPVLMTALLWQAGIAAMAV